MSLWDLKLGTTAKIKKINADAMLKKRLIALGIAKNRQITVLEESIGRQNMKISVGSSEIALRKNEAQLIEMEEIR